ncbi:MAG: GAF domain-containing protein, partial [Deltaproteobacteria bacterium]|nr:GAF domain-containing protein [Deltaproteobacteria bacterium]
MLKSIAEYFNAYGCILWELAPPENERLFTLAHWFPENQIYAIHNLPLADSVTGAAVLGGTINVLDVNEDPRVNRDTPFLDVFSIKSFCSVPIFLSEDSFNTLNLYREGPDPFGPKEVRQIEEVASLIPGFYRAIRDHVSFNLMTTTNKILHKADVAGQVNFTTKSVMKQVIQRICEQVSTAFRCVETSVFLEDPFSRKGEFEKMGTTWPGDFNKKFYSASQDEGITGWVLEKRKPVKIFDLSYFDSDKDEIQLLFPGIRWKDSLEIVPFMVKHFGYASKEQLQPLSFMATPITIGGDVLGVIRCCTAKEGPYYFADRELKTLNLVATRIAQAWRNWVNLRTIEEENRSWESLVTSVSQLNRLVHEELKQEYPKEERIFDRALKMANENISGADILSIRFLDQEKKELYFASFYGDDWKQGTPEEIERRKSRRFPVNGKEATSAGAQAFQTGGVVLTRDVQSMDNHAEPTFPGIQKCLIVSPIVVGDTVVGTLDIRGASEGAFPEHIDTIAGLIGEQLG